VSVDSSPTGSGFVDLQPANTQSNGAYETSTTISYPSIPPNQNVRIKIKVKDSEGEIGAAEFPISIGLGAGSGLLPSSLAFKKPTATVNVPRVQDVITLNRDFSVTVETGGVNQGDQITVEIDVGNGYTIADNGIADATIGYISRFTSRITSSTVTSVKIRVTNGYGQPGAASSDEVVVSIDLQTT